MAVSHKNRVGMSVSGTPGTGTITLGSAITGYQSFASAYGANATVDVLIKDGNAWEVARDCTYTNSGTTLTRGTLEASSTGSALSLTSSAQVFVTATAGRGQQWTDLAGVFGSSAIAVTGATTATAGSMHECSGTSADYTVTLPAASGNSGKMLGFRMGSASALTKLVTLDGNASETIDGALTRIMWAEETAILYCDGSNWFKVAGKSRPMSTRLSRATDQTGIANGTATSIVMTAQDFGPAAMFDSGNGRVSIVRPGKYQVTVSAYITGTTGSISFGYILVMLNGSNLPWYQQSSSISNNAAGAFGVAMDLAASDYLSAGVFHDATTAKLLGAGGSHIAITEIPQW